MIKKVFVILLLASLTQSTWGRKCYVCNTMTEKKCEHPVGHTELEVLCENQEAVIEAWGKINDPFQRNDTKPRTTTTPKSFLDDSNTTPKPKGMEWICVKMVISTELDPYNKDLRMMIKSEDLKPDYKRIIRYCGLTDLSKSNDELKELGIPMDKHYEGNGDLSYDQKGGGGGILQRVLGCKTDNCNGSGMMGISTVLFLTTLIVSSILMK